MSATKITTGVNLRMRPYVELIHFCFVVARCVDSWLEVTENLKNAFSGSMFFASVITA